MVDRLIDPVSHGRRPEDAFHVVVQPLPGFAFSGPTTAREDSPVGRAAWITEKLRAWSDNDGNLNAVISHDEILANVTTYWVTRTAGSSIRLYHESAVAGLIGVPPTPNTVPVSVAVLPKELYRQHSTDRRALLQHRSMDPATGGRSLRKSRATDAAGGRHHRLVCSALRGRVTDRPPLKVADSSPSLSASGTIMSINRVDVTRAVQNSGLSNFQRRTILLCTGLGLADGFNSLSVGYVIHGLADKWDVPLGSFAWVVVSAVIGEILASTMLAPRADRFGRRTMIAVGIVTFGFATLAAAFAPNVWVLAE